MRSDGRSDSGGETRGASVRDHDSGGGQPRLNNRVLALVVATAVVVADQFSKWLAVNNLADGPIVLFDGILRLRLTYNTGASFSSFSNGGPVIALIGFGVIAFVFFIIKDTNRRLEAVGLGLVLGGAIGNILDRVFRGDGLLNGGVVDFVDVQFFAIFNIADSAINIGVLILLIAAFWKRS